MALDPTTRIILEHIGELGYVVEVAYASGHVVTATAATGERWAVRGDDLYAVACELVG
jgi:hypothetical protein